MFLKSAAQGKRPLYACPATETPVPPTTGEDWIRLQGTHDGRPATFGLTEKHLNKHVLLVGSTGCGKTTTFIRMVNQLQRRMTPQDVMIIFDTKGDYARQVKVSGTPLFIANSAPYRARSVRWNLFREILIDCVDHKYDNESVVANTREICASLFAEREKRSNNPFFPSAARDLLSALIIFLIRTGFAPDADSLFRSDFFNNKALSQFLSSRSGEDFCQLLEYDEDLRSVQSYISGGDSQASGVLSEMHSIVRDVLSGVFAEKGGFSIRNFVREKGNKTLFIEYDLSMGSVLTPVYRLLIDLALKEALGRQSQQGNVYLICDEFRLLPHLQHIDDGVNFGRSLGVKVIAGLQSIEQLFEVYEESRGRNIAAGFSTIFAYHSTDPSTISYLTQAYGEYEQLEEYQNNRNENTEYRRKGSVITNWDLVNLDVGEAIVCPAFGAPFTFKFPK